MAIELRWYETYDQYGRNSGKTLQYRSEDSQEWKDVPYIRERKETKE